MNKRIYKKYTEIVYKDEDDYVLKYLSEYRGQKIKYLEIGSGMGRFPEVVKEIHKNWDINCNEINTDLAKRTESMGFFTVNKNFLETNLSENEYQIIHCSHFIEHLGYPEITQALDKMIFALKPDGVLIIRSPLLSPYFYFDIDHVRPYPPESILNYFNIEEQQRRSRFSVIEIGRRYRRSALHIFILENTFFIKIINLLLRSFYILFRLPFSSRNGYILVLKKK